MSPSPRTSLKILHITESLSSGVATAIQSYVEKTPQHEHFLSGWRRPEIQVGDSLDQLTRFFPLPPGKPAQFKMIRNHIRIIRPDILHVHSSFAGVFARLQPKCGAKLVFTPHCFAFERTDISRLTRTLFRIAENLMAFRTDAFIAAGQREAFLCQQLLARKPVTNVPQGLPADLELKPGRGSREKACIVVIGRLEPQKDPVFLLETKKQFEVLSNLTDVEWWWIGGGREHYVQLLKECGVKVTGWLTRAEVLHELSQADVYFHTAAWEASCPLTVLEAERLRIPVVARKIPALEDYEGGGTPESPVVAAQMLIEVLRDARVRDDLIIRGYNHFSSSNAKQREALSLAYTQIISQTS